MKNIFLALVILGVISFSNFVFAKTEILVEKNGRYTNYYAKDDPVRYAKSVTNLPDAKKAELFEYAKTYPDKVKPVVFMALADYIFKTDKNEALFWYFAGRIRATSDIAMCDDTSSRQQLAYYPEMATNTMNYGSQNPKQVKNAIKKALKWDETNKNRMHPQWACYHGSMVFLLNGEVTTKDMAEYEKIQKETRDYIYKGLKKL